MFVRSFIHSLLSKYAKSTLTSPGTFTVTGRPIIGNTFNPDQYLLLCTMFNPPNQFYFENIFKLDLTLIWMAEGVYDFRNV
jgi:hypothetical protein